MIFKRRHKSEPKPAAPDCAGCRDADCVRSPLYRGEMKIRVSDADLYNLSINLIERVDTGEFPCPREAQPKPKPGFFHAAIQTPAPELDSVRADMNRLSGEVRDFQTRLQGLKELEAKLNRSLEQVTSELDLRLDQAMQRGPAAKIGDLAARIEELARESDARAGGPDRVRKLEKEVAAILAGQPGAETLDELKSRLAELSIRAAEKKDLDRAASEIAEVKAHAADLKLLDEIHAALARMESGKASHEDIEALKARIEKIGESSVDLSALDALAEKIEDLRATAAEREQVEKALSGLKELSESAADRDSLEKVSAAVESLRAKSAGRAELMEVAEKIEIFIAEAALSQDLSALAARVSGLDARAAEKSELAEVKKSLDALAERAADREALSEMKQSLEALGERSAEKTALAELKASLEALSARAADRKALEETSSALRGLAGQAAAREAMEELAKSLAALLEKSAERKDVIALRARIDELAAKAAPREEMAGVSRELESLGARMADRETVNLLESQLAGLSRRAAGRLEMETLSASLEKLKSQAVNREQLGKLLEMFKDLSARTADREMAGSILAEVIAVKESSPSREELEKLAARVEEMSGRFAGRADVDQLGSLLSELKGRVLDRAELKKFLEQFKELSSRWADRDGLNEVQARVEEIRGSLQEMDLAYDSIKERLAVEAADRPMDNGLGERLAEIEKGLSSLRDVSLRVDVVPEVEQRLMALEKVTFAKSAAAAAAAGGPEEKPGDITAIKGMERVIDRIKKVESEHEDLRRQIIKAFENLSAYPLRELNELKDKIRELEKAAQRPMPRVVPPPGRVAPPRPSHWTERLTKAKGWKLAAGIVIAATAGVLALWLIAQITGWSSNLSASATSQTKEEDARPNKDYEDSGDILGTPSLDMATSKISLVNGKTDIYGSAPGAARALLFVNSQLVGETEVVEGSFTFHGVSLEYGRNAIQVRAEDAGKNGLNSLAEIFDKISLETAKIDPHQVINRMRGPKDQPYLCLTLDAGGSGHRAKEVLDVLKSKGIRTTFFLTGQFIEKNPEIATRIVNEGHEVGNHTYTHPHLTTYERNRTHQTHPGMNRERLMNELVRTREQFERVTRHKMSRWWRAPYGEYNSSILTWAKEAGFDHIDWTRRPQNLDMLDWKTDPQDPKYLNANGLFLRLTTIDNGVAYKANGSIILCHLGSDRGGEYLDGILGEAIDTLRGRNYQFVTVSKMFGETD